MKEATDVLVLAPGLAEGIEVRLGCVVQTIAHDETGVTVRTSGWRFHAVQTVVTLPLGELKAGSVVFDPPLPKAKQSAIEPLRPRAFGGKGNQGMKKQITAVTSLVRRNPKILCVCIVEPIVS